MEKEKDKNILLNAPGGGVEMEECGEYNCLQLLREARRGVRRVRSSCSPLSQGHKAVSPREEAQGK